MRSQDQVGAAERTAAAPTDIPSARRRAEEFTARRRGALRRYLFDHPRIMDLIVVASYLLLTAFSMWGAQGGGKALPHVALMVAAAGVLMFRRTKPLAVVLVLSMLEIANIFIDPTTSNAGTSLWFGLYSLAVAYRPVVSFAVAAVASMPLIAYLLLFYQLPAEFVTPGGPSAAETSIITAIVVLLSNIIATGIGASVRSMRQHEEELKSWAVRNAQLASVAERNRIAREMHDVVAHSLTVMVALSDGAAVVVKRDPQKAGDVLGQLSQTGRNALADMRRVLGVLREESGSSEARLPQPNESDLVALFEGFRQAGLPLIVTQSGPALPMDPTLQLTVYRIVQESLTNVLRYATAVAKVRVVTAYSPGSGEVRLSITDDGHGSVERSMGGGQGIIGMRERAGIYAGSVSAGPTNRGGWRVEAVLQLGAEKP